MERPVTRERQIFTPGEKVRLNRLSYATRKLLESKGIDPDSPMTVEGYDEKHYDKCVIVVELKPLRDEGRIHEMFLNRVGYSPSRARRRSVFAETEVA